jgi:hypothetical protein
MWRFTCIVGTTMLLAACGGGGDNSTPTPSGPTPSGPTPPSALSYQSPETAVVGQAISLSASVSGSVTSYAVSPALPAGLSINTTTGTISGTPSSVSAKSTYTVTASNSGGSTTFAWVLTINPAAPTALSYSTPPPLLVGKAISSLTPTVSGTVTSYSVNPALPAGLTIDASTGVITGSPSAVTAAATYTVTASNVTGQTNSGLSLTVDPGPTVHLTVAAIDPNGYSRAYQWKTTDGVLLNVSGAQADWMLPAGPGLHFAYVLVSNGKGGYTQRRIAVNTDTIGNPIVPTAPQTLQAPAPPVPPPSNAHAFRAFVEVGIPNTPLENHRVAGVQVRWKDPAGALFPPKGPVTSTADGAYVMPDVPVSPVSPVSFYEVDCSVDSGVTFSDCTEIPGRNPADVLDSGAPILLSTALSAGTVYRKPDHYTATSTANGSLLRSDLQPCGVVDEFFGIHSLPSATVTDLNTGQILLPSAPFNEFGSTAFAAQGSNLSVKFTCEAATPVTINGINIPANAGSMYLGAFVLANVAAPAVSGMTATYNGDSSVGTFTPPPSGQPSDKIARPDAFLTYKGLDTRRGACQYYKAVGATKDCDASGNLVNPVSFEDWKRAVRIGAYAVPGTPEYTATYINQYDLNLARDHHSISYGPNQTAAYVCNHLGPTVLNPSQSQDAPNNPSIDTVVANTVKGLNLIACVAMDTAPSAVMGGQPFVRFLIFGPGGQLLPSVNLDGRTEKFVPGTCVACHGGDYYAGTYPEDGFGRADIGAHFIPYDTGNFAFSSKPGLTEADQSDQIYHLNQNVLNANPTPQELTLINAWYPNGTHTLDKTYVPAAWAAYDTPTSTPGSNVYRNVYAHSCRGCHITLVPAFNFEAVSGSETTVPGHNAPLYLGGEADNDFGIAVCGGGQDYRNYLMPNSLVTFNRFWGSQGSTSTPDQPAALDALYGVGFLNGTPSFPQPCSLTVP